jgi:hypothetical protein
LSNIVRGGIKDRARRWATDGDGNNVVLLFLCY